MADMEFVATYLGGEDDGLEEKKHFDKDGNLVAVSTGEQQMKAPGGIRKVMGTDFPKGVPTLCKDAKQAAKCKAMGVFEVKEQAAGTFKAKPGKGGKE
jgi:hypothetical protein